MNKFHRRIGGVRNEGTGRDLYVTFRPYVPVCICVEYEIMMFPSSNTPRTCVFDAGRPAVVLSLLWHFDRNVRWRCWRTRTCPPPRVCGLCSMKFRTIFYKRLQWHSASASMDVINSSRDVFLADPTRKRLCWPILTRRHTRADSIFSFGSRK